MKSMRKLPARSRAALAALVGVTLLTAWHSTGAAPQRARSAAESRVAAALALPFRSGEALRYSAAWENFLTAATLELQAQGPHELNSRASWQFSAVVTSIAPVRYLYAIDDRFTSDADAASLASLRYHLRRREPNRDESRTIHFAREGEAAPEGVSVVRVTPETRDPVAALYFLRAVDWSRAAETRFEVFDGEKLYHVRARREPRRETRAVPAGRFSTFPVALRIFEGLRERADVTIRVWLSDDRARVPVLVEAELPIGRVRVELTARKRPS
jgi:hypothetical protein